MPSIDFTEKDVENYWRYIAESEAYNKQRHSVDFPEEVQWVIELVNARTTWKYLLSWGSADGQREPAGILAAVEDARRTFDVVCVECTDRWIDFIRRNMSGHLQSGRCEKLTLLVSQSQEFSRWLEGQAKDFPPSVLLLGCYDCDQIIDRDPDPQNWIGIKSYLNSLREGFPFDGEFIFAVLVLDEGRVKLHAGRSVRVTREEILSDFQEADRVQLAVERMVREFDEQAVGVLVIAPCSHGTFQSTWYRKASFSSFLGLATARRPLNLEVRPGTKGFLCVVPDGENRNRGAAWLLNNVLGCTYWRQQVRDLQQVCQIVGL